MLLIRALDLRIGRPTSDGNMCSGKLLPAKPHLTNLNQIKSNIIKKAHSFSYLVLYAYTSSIITHNNFSALSIHFGFCFEKEMLNLKQYLKKLKI